MTTRDDLNTPMIAVVGLISAIVVFAIILLLMVVFHSVESQHRDAQQNNQPYVQVSQLKAKAEGRLASYGWVNQERGIALIPVARAMDLVVDEFSQDPSAAVTRDVQPEAAAPQSGKEGDDGP